MKQRQEGDMGENLIESIQGRVAKMREEYIPAYQSIGPEGVFGVAMMRAAIQRAEKAVAAMDTVEMVSSLQELRDFKL
jgi:hypothetical protein